MRPQYQLFCSTGLLLLFQITHECEYSPNSFQILFKFTNFSHLFLASFFLVTYQFVSLKRHHYIMKTHFRWFYQQNRKNFTEFVITQKNNAAEFMAWQSKKVNLNCTRPLFSFFFPCVLFVSPRKERLSCHALWHKICYRFVEFAAGTHPENTEQYQIMMG